MWVYLISTILIFYWAFITYVVKGVQKEQGIDLVRNNELFINKNLIITIISGLILLSVASLKSYTVGSDTLRYLQGYETIRFMNWDNLGDFGWEYGYVLINKLFSQLNFEFRVFIFVISFAILALILVTVYKYSAMPWLSILIFIFMDFYSFMLSGYRQAIAIAIVVYSVNFLMKRKLMKFFLTVLLASLFHQSAIIFLIMYPITKLKINKFYFVIVSMIAMVLYLFGDLLVNLLISLYGRNQVLISGQGYGMLVVLFSITITGILMLKYTKVNTIQSQILSHIMIWAVILQILSTHMSIFVRAINYFSINAIFFIPLFLSGLKDSFVKRAIILLLLVVLFIYYLYLMNVDGNRVTPYIFYWGEY